MHYPSHTAAPSRGFPDFLLRAPAASAADPESSSSTDISESEEEDTNNRGASAAVETAQPVPPASPRVNATVPNTEAQEASE